MRAGARPRAEASTPAEASAPAPPPDSPPPGAAPGPSPRSEAPRDLDDAIVRMVGVSRRFQDVVAVEEIGLAVWPGTIIGVIGPSGAGKTTTLRLLTGALRPTAGTVRVLGQDPTHLSPGARRRIGYMPQVLTLQPDLTASENVDLAASLAGMLWFARRRRVGHVLELLDLSPQRGRPARHLSGGMQRRVALASALVHDPDLLFLDEPTAGIDPLLRERVWKELHRLRSEGRTLVVTTQYVNEAEDCDAVAVIARGRLVALGTPAELRRRVTGGDAVDIETGATIDAEDLRRLPEVRSVRQLGPRLVRVAVDDAGTAVPALVAAIDERGGAVVASREVRPTYDEVFAALLEESFPVDELPADQEAVAAG